MEDNLFDKIYALRISLMDTYYDETKIIYYIKQNLFQYDNINTDEKLNDIIINFYKKYDIDITTIDFSKLNIIGQTNTEFYNPEIEYFNNFINIYNNLINTTIEDELDENVENDLFNSNLDSDGDINSSNNDTEIDTDYNNDSNSQEQNIDSNSQEQNIVSNSFNNHNITQVTNISPNRFLDIIDIFTQALNNSQTYEQEMEDVLVTLDDNDYNNLIKIKYSDLKENKEKKCSICIDEYKDDDDIIVLPCKHYFHKNCVQEWLKEYNYKCPICRKECGKSKYNL